MPDTGWRLLVTCEHATHRIPAPYRSAFAKAGRLLASHRGFDPGALELAKTISRQLRAPLKRGTTSRLLVELNRSVGHPRLWSDFTRDLPPPMKQEILTRYYYPHRLEVLRWIKSRVTRGHRVLHLSVHTFTPVWEGEPRVADIGLLHDPRRASERTLCLRWKQTLRAQDPSWRVRRNYPYQGVADGFTTHLRKSFDAGHYAGIELEVTQAWARSPRRRWLNLQKAIAHSLSGALRLRAFPARRSGCSPEPAECPGRVEGVEG